MNALSWILLVVVLAILTFVIYRIIKKKGKSCSCSCSSCSSCPYSGGCRKK